MAEHSYHRRNAAMFIVVAVTVLLGILAANSVQAEKAQALGLPFIDLPSPCDLLPDGTAAKICKGATDPSGTTGDLIGSIPGVPNPTDIVKDTVGAVANAIVEPIITQIAQAEADSVVWILQIEGRMVTSSTSPDLTAAWFTQPYALVYGLAVFIALGMFIAKVTAAVHRGDPVRIGNVLAAFVVFFLAASILPAIVAGAVYVTDKEITPAFISASGASLNQTLGSIKLDFSKEITGTNNPIVPILVPMIALFFGVLGGLAALALLIVRYAFLPFGTIAVLLGLAMNVGLDWGVEALKKSVLWLLGWILFLPAIGLTLLLGATILANANSNPLTSITAGVVLVLAPALALIFTRAVSRHQFKVAPVERTVEAIRSWRVIKGTY